MACEHKNIEMWDVHPVGNTWYVRCRDCGGNATWAAEDMLGVSQRYDTIEMAREHLDLARYERSAS